MKGKVCLITGATDGLGKVSARVLAERGATVVGVGRNPYKIEAAIDHIRLHTDNPNVEMLHADLSSQAQVRALVAEFRTKYIRLDVLMNNAGNMFQPRQESEDGIEMTFALNHLSYFLLTNLLLDMLIDCTPARIINVSSGMHTSGKIDFDDLGNSKRYVPWDAYADSKLANVLFSYELARRLEGTGVTANALHPGGVATNFGADAGYRASGISPEEGAQTQIYLATSPEVEGVTGKYFVRCRAVPSSQTSYDEDTARRLWAVNAQMTGLNA
jgi:NAD(P)-dependent dehydrogenase (short-subunit alcohol dehydrogenase family)